MKTYSTRTYIIPGVDIEIELPCAPSVVMGYRDPLVHVSGTHAVLGYLADDGNCANPLTDWDGMGSIYEARYRCDTLGGYCRALGLYNDGSGPDLRLVDEEAAIKVAVDRILADPDERERALQHCMEHWDRNVPDDEFIRRCLDSLEELAALIDTDDLLLEMWQAGRRAGTIGDKHAVLVDVYEHGGIAYSVAGRGMQDQFDTARGGAVWVPDDCARDELLRRAEVYRKGDVNALRGGGYEVRTLRDDTTYSGVTHPNFAKWHEAFAYLRDLDVTHWRGQDEAEEIAAQELAQQACEVYTKWCNGECYGVVVVTHDRVNGETLGVDSCWGYVGSDDAMEALEHDYFAPAVKDLEAGHAD